MVKIRYIVMMLFAGLWACTIKPPEVHITSEKTALENQMFGEKARISEELPTSIAVWASLDQYSWETGKQKELTDYRDEYNKRRLTLAQIRRKTMSEYINEFKRQGILGETYDGHIAVMPDSLKDNSLLGKVASAENRDRDIILTFFFESRGMVKEEDKSAARAEFARVMAQTSPDGTWIQDHDGNWTAK